MSGGDARESRTLPGRPPRGRRSAQLGSRKNKLPLVAAGPWDRPISGSTTCSRAPCPQSSHGARGKRPPAPAKAPHTRPAAVPGAQRRRREGGDPAGKRRKSLPSPSSGYAAAGGPTRRSSFSPPGLAHAKGGPESRQRGSVSLAARSCTTSESSRVPSAAEGPERQRLTCGRQRGAAAPAAQGKTPPEARKAPHHPPAGPCARRPHRAPLLLLLVSPFGLGAAARERAGEPRGRGGFSAYRPPPPLGVRSPPRVSFRSRNLRREPERGPRKLLPGGSAAAPGLRGLRGGARSPEPRAGRLARRPVWTAARAGGLHGAAPRSAPPPRLFLSSTRRAAAARAPRTRTLPARSPAHARGAGRATAQPARTAGREARRQRGRVTGGSGGRWRGGGDGPSRGSRRPRQLPPGPAAASASPLPGQGERGRRAGGAARAGRGRTACAAGAAEPSRGRNERRRAGAGSGEGARGREPGKPGSGARSGSA